jgi:hypothetical protein
VTTRVTVADPDVRVAVVEPVTVVTVETAGSRDALFLQGYPILYAGPPAVGTVLVFNGTGWVPTTVAGLAATVEDEAPSGAIDGANQTFSTAFPYVS